MRNPFHLVSYSPWPMLISLNLLGLLISLVGIMNGSLKSNMGFFWGFLSVLYMLYSWMLDMMTESNLGNHSYLHNKNLLVGFMWFCITEMMMFFSLFWGYFHSAWNPAYLMWPPMGIEPMNTFSVPLLNTVLLFWAGLAATAGHHYYVEGLKEETMYFIKGAWGLTVVFLFCQIFEFYYSSFDMSDSSFGTCFFALTGLHGMHMFMAIMAMAMLLYRLMKDHNTDVYLNSVLLYFHLLDAIWMLLVLLVYLN